VKQDTEIRIEKIVQGGQEIRENRLECIFLFRFHPPASNLPDLPSSLLTLDAHDIGKASIADYAERNSTSVTSS
jgi:hypothetical protein